MKPLHTDCRACLFLNHDCGNHEATPPVDPKPKSGEPRAEEPATPVDAAFPAEPAPGETEESIPASVELLVAKTFQLANDLALRDHLAEHLEADGDPTIAAEEARKFEDAFTIRLNTLGEYCLDDFIAEHGLCSAAAKPIILQALERRARLRNQPTPDAPPVQRASGLATTVPPELVSLRRWICWRLEPSVDGKPRKVPASPCDGTRIGATSVGKNGEDWAAHWVDFAAARAGAIKHHLTGIGFVFCEEDGRTGIDFDNCRDAQSGEIHPAVREWLVRFDSYAEISPSGTGLHVVVAARLNRPGNKRPLPADSRIKVELYDDARFFTWTGQRLEGKPLNVRPAQAAVDALHKYIFANDVIPDVEPLVARHHILSTNEIQRRLAVNAWKDIFNKAVPPAEMITKRYHGDHSTADMALCVLARRFTVDPAQIIELWQQSSLWRDKSAIRPDYVKATIQKAFAVHRAKGMDTRDRTDVLWQWEGYLPLGKLVIMDGDPAMTKSMLALRLAVSVMTGREFPDGKKPLVTGAVVLLSAEDEPHDTIAPRLVAAGAPDGVIPLHYLGVMKKDGGAFALTSPDDLTDIELLIADRGAKLVIVDPLNAYLGDKVDTHNDQKIRAVLGPLSEVANRTGATILAIRHLRKAGGTKAIYVGMGSIGYTAAARANFFVGEHPDEKDVFVFSVSKSNLGPKPTSLKYRLSFATVPQIAKPVPYVTGFEPCSLTANEVVAAQKEENEGGGKLSEAVAFLRKLLATGVVTSARVEAAARSEGISEATLRRAKKSLDVQSGQHGRAWSCWLKEKHLFNDEATDTRSHEKMPF